MYLGGDEDFITYLGHIFVLTAVVIGIPTVVIGILLPYLFKFSESRDAIPGEAVGRLVSINTVGAIIGSICAGFLLLDWFGLWSSLKVVASLYVVAAILISIGRPLRVSALLLVPVLGVLSLFTVLDTGKLPVVKIDINSDKETLLKVWEGSDATVAVVRRNGFLRTKLINWYTLGSTGDMTTQQIQTHLPMLLHPNPKQVFYLGLGTGITAGTALNYKVENVVVTEIAPSAIQASAEYFKDYTNGLFEDARVEIIAEDGRNVLRGSPKIYDLIISDLFIPWKAGTGTLYSIEHYQTARERLSSDGMYVQWLPLYQLTQEEFTIIARTMLEVFPTVSQWRGNFWGDKAVVALIGHKGISNLDPNSPLMRTSRLALNVEPDAKLDRLPLIAHYAGSITVDDSWFLNATLNTDSLPIIEYIAPINHRLEKAGKAEWLLGQKMLEYVAPYLSKDSLMSDPYLSKIDSAWYDVIAAGYYLQASFVLRDSKNNASQEATANSELLLKRASTKLSKTKPPS